MIYGRLGLSPTSFSQVRYTLGSSLHLSWYELNVPFSTMKPLGTWQLIKSLFATSHKKTALALFHVNAGRPPFGGKDNYEVLNHVKFDVITLKPELFGHISVAGKEFVISCLQRHVDLRPTAIELQQHRWFQILDPRSQAGM